MSMKKLVVMLTVVVVVLATASVQFWRQLNEARREVADLQAQIQTFERYTRTSAARDVPASVTEAPEELASVATVSGSPTAPPAAAELNAERRTAVAMAAVASPERQEQARLISRARQEVQYPDIGKVVGLSKEQVDQLFDLMTLQNERRTRELRMGPTNGESTLEAVGRRAKEDDAEQIALLGNKYPDWKRYQKELPTRQHMRDLGAVLNAASSPLSDERAESLLSALVTVQDQLNLEAMAQISSGNPQVRSFNNPERDKRFIDVASRYLTPQQLEAYQQMVERKASEKFFTTGPREIPAR